MTAPSDEAGRSVDGEPLVTAMTRPTMIGGLTLSSIALSLYVPGMVAMLTRSLLPAAAIPLLLAASYLVCLRDVYLFDIALAATHLKRCPNRAHWGCRRYAPR